MEQHPILADIELFLDRHKMTESTFGRKVENNWKLVKSIREGRRLWPDTAQRIRDFMIAYPNAPHDETGEQASAA